MFSKFTRIVAIIATVLTLQSCSKSSDSTTTVPSPSAGFTFTASGTVAPETVTFTNTSTNATSYLWNFGDNSTSTGISPTHVFTTSGTYTVTLIATNSNGSNSYSQVVSVGNAVQPPVASFTYSGANAFAPDNVSFVSTSSNATSFSWNFGDNSSVVTTANALHVFTTSGVYTVTLTVTNAGGSNSVSQTINVSPAPTKVELDTIVLNSTGVTPSTTSYNAYFKIVQVSTSAVLSTTSNYSLIYPNAYNLYLIGSSFYTFTGIGSSSSYQIQVYQYNGIFSSDTMLGFITFNPFVSATSGSSYYPKSIHFVNGGTNITLKVKWLP